MKMKRAIYLGYYLKQLDKNKFSLFLEYTSNKTGISKISLLYDILKSVFKYNISILEYFQFRFYELSTSEREAWAGTGHMYEYQLKMNPRNNRDILENKTLFYKHYGEFFTHRVADIEDLRNKPDVADAILFSPSGKLVFKPADGNCGTDVEIRDCEDFGWQSLIEFMENSDYDLVEEYIEQHPEMNRLSPSAVNTVRIFTQLNGEDEVDILGCRLRISVDSPVDNMAAGNLAAPIDETTGRLSGPAVYSDITKGEKEYHPITNVKIPGFQIPFWTETLQMVKKAARLHPQNRSIGWDIVITEKGPGLIEGNHDWCKLLWQLPVKEGLKSVLKDIE
ncbi:sugar-transfer associated ATP-grasp domain-containing protein [Fodinibius roseus]|nr:sugar-transfer associated ATP-grasp domain-containing protein [Fodinibius roseus]